MSDDTAFAATLDSADRWPGRTAAGSAFDGDGRYVVERELGSGGMGTAWLARDTLLLRPCVIKVLHAAGDAEANERFLREARLTARLRHEHIVATFDLGLTAAHVPFLVLERLEGRPLDAVLREAGTLSVLRTVAIGVQIVRALRAAHLAGVVHHDLKPANVFVTREGLVKLLDFGIAAFVGDGGELAETNPSAAGTPFYMAPEQWHGTRADARSDLWAVGVVLYELLTGRVPFTGETAMAVATQVLSEEPPPLPPSFEAGHDMLAALITASLTKDPTQRPASAAAMLETLEALWKSLSAGVSTDPKPRAAGALPEPVRDADVQFTVYAPGALPPGRWTQLVTFAHRALDEDERGTLDYDDPVAQVAREAREVLGDEADRYSPQAAAGVTSVPRAHELTFVPRAEGVRFDPPSRTFTWSAPVHRELFLARPEHEGVAEARLEVYLGALLLAEVRFALTAKQTEAPPEPVRARPFERVFVAYAAADAAVAMQIKSLTAALTGTRFVEASAEEHAAGAIEHGSRSAIDDADALQLLWSSAALASEVVDSAVRYALGHRGAGFVRPVCWEHPAPIDEARDRPPAVLRAAGLSSIAAPATALLAAVAGGAAQGPPPLALSAAGAPAPIGGSLPFGAPSPMSGSAPAAPQMRAAPAPAPYSTSEPHVSLPESAPRGGGRGLAIALGLLLALTVIAIAAYLLLT